MLEYWRGQNWVIPMLAGEPFMEKPPLYYLVAVAFAKLLSPWLPLHDAARLASAFFIALTAAALAGTARLTWGAGYGRFAVLALFSTLGLVIPAHMLLTDNANLAGIAIALLGFAAVQAKRRWAALALGSGAGIAFLAKGILGPGLVAVSALLLFIFPMWRTRAYWRTLLMAFVVALPWCVIWPTLLYRQAPDLFFEWFWQNNFGRFFGFAPDSLNAVNQADFWYRVLPWATFPLLPIALLALYRFRHNWSRNSAVHIALASISALLLVLLTSASVRGIYALPMLPGLALLAAPLLRAPPHWLTSLLSRSGWLLFVSLGSASWLFWLLLVNPAAPPLVAPLAALFSSTPLAVLLQPYAPMPLQLGGVLAAFLLTAFWCFCQWSWRHIDWRGAATWYSSLLITLALAWLLWMPWAIAKNSSYRPLFEQIGSALPSDTCVANIGLGESQRGMLDYVLGLQTTPPSDDEFHNCDALLIDASERDPERHLEPEWQLALNGKRAANDHEKFMLYVRHGSQHVFDGRHRHHRSGKKFARPRFRLS